MRQSPAGSDISKSAHPSLLRCWVIGGLLLCCALAGCSKKTTPPKIAGEEGELVQLPRTFASPHQGLKDELDVLKQTAQLPRMLAERFPYYVAEKSPTTAYTRLNRCYPPLSRSILADHIAELVPRASGLLGPVELAKTQELLARYAENRKELRAILREHPTGPELPLAMGPLVDVECLDAAEIAIQIEVLAAAAALSTHHPAAAEEAIETGLKLAAWLAEEPSVTVRIVAAQTRHAALQSLAALITQRQADSATVERLHRVIDQQIATWPLDSQLWEGDRLQGLITYEIIRSGHYFSLLPADEMKTLEEQGILKTTARAVLKNIDDDEQFYLRAMRQMIEASNQPYFLRKSRLDTLRAELDNLRLQPLEPLIASSMLLVDFDAAHRWQAIDRSRMDAWSLALGAALGKDVSPIESQLTGELFRITAVEERLVISGVSVPDEPITIYRMSPAQPTSAPPMSSQLPRALEQPYAAEIQPAFPAPLPAPQTREDPAALPSYRTSRPRSVDVFPSQPR